MDIVSMGVIIQDMFPGELGVKLQDMPFWIPAPGGAPANVAVGAAKLGARSAFVGKVGDDAFGRHLIRTLKSEGVDVSGLRLDPDARTTLNFHAKPLGGAVEYLFYRNPGADTRIAPEDLNAALFEDVKVYHYDSMSLTHEPIRAATREAIRWTKRAGGLVSFDVNYRPPVWKCEAQAAEVALDWARSADIVKLNEAEIEMVCPGMTLNSAAERLLELGPTLVLVTQGERGVFYATGRFSARHPAFEVEPVETIGCGDSFISAFLTGLISNDVPSLSELEREALDALVRTAQAAAAITATRAGVIPALPSAAELRQFEERWRGE